MIRWLIAQDGTPVNLSHVVALCIVPMGGSDVAANGQRRSRFTAYCLTGVSFGLAEGTSDAMKHMRSDLIERLTTSRSHSTSDLTPPIDDVNGGRRGD